MQRSLAAIILMLKEWQQMTFGMGFKPTQQDIIMFLHRSGDFDEYNYDVLRNWNRTRYKREFLNDQQITEWFQFYFIKYHPTK